MDEKDLTVVEDTNAAETIAKTAINTNGAILLGIATALLTALAVGLGVKHFKNKKAEIEITEPVDGQVAQA